MTPKHIEELVEKLVDIRNDFSCLYDHLDNLVDCPEEMSPNELQRNKAMRNREDAIDELLRKEGLWW